MSIASLNLRTIRLLTLFMVMMSGFLTVSPVLAKDLDAVLQWKRTVPMSTPVSGVVVEVDAQVGKRVNKGHVLLRLGDKVFRAQVKALEAKLKSARNNRDESNREMGRAQNLYDRTLISDHELELAKIQRDDGEAQYQNTIAVLMQAKTDLQYSAVRAPFPALVTQRNVEIGQTIISKLQAEPLVVLVDANAMIARLDVSGDDLSKYHIGYKGKVMIGEKSYSGKISRIALSPTQGTKDKYSVYVSFDPGDTIYRAGQSAKVRF